MSEPIKLTQPETLRQAETFTVLNNAAVAAGYCYACAAQHAYGRQHGWAQVHPPCIDCLPVAWGDPNARKWAPSSATVGLTHSPTQRPGEPVAESADSWARPMGVLV